MALWEINQSEQDLGISGWASESSTLAGSLQRPNVASTCVLVAPGHIDHGKKMTWDRCGKLGISCRKSSSPLHPQKIELTRRRDGPSWFHVFHHRRFGMSWFDLSTKDSERQNNFPADWAFRIGKCPRHLPRSVVSCSLGDVIKEHSKPLFYRCVFKLNLSDV